MNNGFTPIRNAIQEHLEKGRLTYFDFGIYVKIHLGADYRTGVWWGSAKKLLAEGPADGSLRRIRESMRRLASIIFIKPFRVSGRRGNYPVLINKFDLRGELKGYRVNADKTTDWRHPVLEARTDDVPDNVTDDVTDDVTESIVSPPHSASSNPLRSKKGRSKKSLPAKKRQADQRFSKIVEHYFLRTKQNTEANAQWDGPDGDALNRILKNQPDTPAETINQWLDNAFDSTDPYAPLKRGFRFTEFGKQYLTYTKGPLRKGEVASRNQRPLDQQFEEVERRRAGVN